MQHHSCDFAPVNTLCIRVEQAEIRDNVLLVIDGQCGIRGRGIGDVGIKRRLLHPANRLLIDQLALGLLAYSLSVSARARSNANAFAVLRFTESNLLFVDKAGFNSV